MKFGEQEIDLADLIDINFLQELQDNFAKTANLASVTVDNNGYVTEPSNFSEFCICTKSTEEGLKRCSECDLKRRELGFKKNEPLFYNCYADLKNFVVPILVNGKPIALIVGGQSLTKKPEENFYRQLAREIGVDEDNYVKLINKIPIVTEEKIHSAAKLLFLVANSISETTHKNKKEKIIREIIQKMRSSLDKEEIKKYFLEMTCRYFNADRCLFIDYDKNTNRFCPFRLEILKSDDYPSLANIDVENAFPEFAEKIKKGKNIIIRDVEKTLAKNRCQNYKSIQTLKKSDAKSDYGLLIKHQDQIMGCLILHFIKEKRNLTHDEFNFLKKIRDHSGTALYQAELYAETKQQAQREKVIRKIIEAVRSSLDINQVKKIVVEELGKALNADRCYFRTYDRLKNWVSPPGPEYLSSPEVQSMLNTESPQDSFTYFIDAVEKRKKKFYPLVIDESITKTPAYEAYAKMFNIKADYAIPIVDRQDKLIWLVLHYVNNDPKLSEDDLKLLETVAYQIDIAFEQITLYNAMKKKIKNESLLRSITEVIRDTLDINETKEKIVTTIGQLYNADRCYIVEYDAKNDKFLMVKDEYLSSQDILSYKTVDLNTTIPSFADAIKKGKQVLINDSKIFVDDNLSNLEPEIRNIEKHNIKSAFGFPIIYQKELIGAFSIHFTRDHYITNDEIEFLNLIANQIAIAIHQSQLYEKIKLQAERERISKNIIEIMRSTMDKNIIKRLFVKNIGKFFNADRVLYSEYDKYKNIYLPTDENSEFLSTPKEKSLVGFDWSQSGISEFIKPLLDKRELHIYSIDRYIKENQKGQDFINFFETYDIKSSYNFPVLYEQNIIGFFCIDFMTKEQRLTDEDINRVRSICTQAGIALHQADLYIKAQEALSLKSQVVNKVKKEIEQPVISIIQNSKELGEFEFETKQKKCLDNIIESCNQLLELTNNIEDL